MTSVASAGSSSLKVRVFETGGTEGPRGPGSWAACPGQRVLGSASWAKSALDGTADMSSGPQGCRTAPALPPGSSLRTRNR